MTSSANTRDEVSALTAGMANLHLFVALRTTVDGQRLTGSLVLAHLNWMIVHEARGVIFASGPFDLNGQDRGASGGMTILRVNDERTARELLDTDPFMSSGAVTYELRRWRLMEGSLGLGLRLSGGQVEFV